MNYAFTPTNMLKQSKSSKLTIDDQIKQEIEAFDLALRSHSGNLDKLRFIIIKILDLDRNVTNPSPFLNYALKERIVDELTSGADPVKTKEEKISLLGSFQEKASQIKNTFLEGKKTSAASYIQEYGSFLPNEFKMLLRAEGLKNVENASYDTVVAAVSGCIQIKTHYEKAYLKCCTDLQINDESIDKISQSINPKINWTGSAKDFASLYYSLHKNSWIEDYFNPDRTTAKFLKSHFFILDRFKKDIEEDALRMNLLEVNHAFARPNRSKINIKDLAFSPTELPENK